MSKRSKAQRARRRIMTTERLVSPTDAQMASGNYYPANIIHAESGTRAGVHRTRHDPVQRWLDAGRLSTTQDAAIALLRALWARLEASPSVTASYGERTGGHSDAERNAAAKIEARDDLTRIEGYFAGLRKWWDVFENVCRWDMAAGVAGSELGYGSRGAEIRAHTIVCFVADKIAEQERL